MQDQRAFEVNPLIEKLVADSKGEEISCLEGYVGPSDSDSKALRLYGTLRLTYFADIPRDAVLHAREVPGAPDGLVQLFMRSATEIRLHSARDRQSDGVATTAMINGTVEDWNYCLIECVARHQPGSPGYDKCAKDCDTNNPHVVGLFAST